VFQNKVLRKAIGRKRDKVTRDWRRQHNVLCSSPSISLLWGGACGSYWDIRGACGSEIGHLEDLGLGGRIILKRILKIRPIFHALIDCMKCITTSRNAAGFVNAILLYSGHQHVSATHVALFMAWLGYVMRMDGGENA